jgi:hypothetical protein
MGNGERNTRAGFEVCVCLYYLSTCLFVCLNVCWGNQSEDTGAGAFLCPCLPTDSIPFLWAGQGFFLPFSYSIPISIYISLSYSCGFHGDTYILILSRSLQGHNITYIFALRLAGHFYIHITLCFLGFGIIGLDWIRMFISYSFLFFTHYNSAHYSAFIVLV